MIDNEAMFETAESVKQYGVLVPAIARPRDEGGYELVAGHRRKRACELAELTTMPALQIAQTMQKIPKKQTRENTSAPMNATPKLCRENFF